MVKLLLEEQHGRVSFLRFNRPERDNRISADLATELTQRLLDLDADPAVGVVVLGGVGPVFCLGGDHTGSGPTTADHLTFTKDSPPLRRLSCNWASPCWLRCTATRTPEGSVC
jgi:enoyl-CoA hydratase/carnithine racemase